MIVTDDGSRYNIRQPLSRFGIQVNGRTAAPFPLASLSGEGLEGWAAAVRAFMETQFAASLPGSWRLGDCSEQQQTLQATSLRCLAIL